MNIKLSLLVSAFVLVPASAFADDQTQSQPKPGIVVEQPLVTTYVEPQAVPYRGGRIPADATIEKRPNMPVIITGLTIVGVAYLPSVITAIAACGPQTDCTATKGAGWLYLPVVGPFVTAAMSTSPGGAALAAFDGGLQLTGAAIAIAGVVAKQKFVVWQGKSAALTVVPNASAQTAGLSLTLTHL